MIYTRSSDLYRTRNLIHIGHILSARTFASGLGRWRSAGLFIGMVGRLRHRLSAREKCYRCRRSDGFIRRRNIKDRRGFGSGKCCRYCFDRQENTHCRKLYSFSLDHHIRYSVIFRRGRLRFPSSL